MSWKDILKNHASEQEVRKYAQHQANVTNTKRYVFQNGGRWFFDSKPPINIRYEVVKPQVAPKLDFRRKFSDDFKERLQ